MNFPTQTELKENLDLGTADKIFELSLDKYGCVTPKYSQTGNELLLTSSTGNLALVKWKSFDLLHENCALSNIRSSAFLSQGFFAISTDQHISLHNFSGHEIHTLNRSADFLAFSERHYLMTSVNRHNEVVWFDTTIGKQLFSVKAVARPIAKTNSFDKSTAALFDGVVVLANSNAHNMTQTSSYQRNESFVSFFSPKSAAPLACIQACKTGTVRSLSVTHLNRGTSFDSAVLATLSSNNTLSLWDTRNYFAPVNTFDLTAAVKTYFGKRPAEVVSVRLANNFLVFTDTNNLFVANFGTLNELEFVNRVEQKLTGFALCPFEPVVGIGAVNQFTSAIIPGLETADEKNLDSLAYNFPYTKSRENKAFIKSKEINHLLEKLSPETIRLDFEENTKKDFSSKEEEFLFNRKRRLKRKIERLEVHVASLEKELEKIRVKNKKRKKMGKGKRTAIKKGEMKKELRAAKTKLHLLSDEYNNLVKEEKVKTLMKHQPSSDRSFAPDVIINS